VALSNHEVKVLRDIGRHAGATGFALSAHIGCRVACEALERRGFVSTITSAGPRGGKHWTYYLTDAGRERLAQLNGDA
jgi:DNA-binding MarR family transcriptional regulator